jgi:hypothetical protein
MSSERQRPHRIRVTRGTNAERLTRPAATQELFNVFLETDTGAAYAVILDNTATKVWTLLADGDASTFVSSKYWVSEDGYGGYTSYAAALAAALADGHGPADPATICVLPGTYAEGINLVEGIDVLGIAPPGSEAVTFTLAASSLSAGATLNVANIAFVGALPIAMLELGGGGGASIYNLRGCLVRNTGPGGLVRVSNPTAAELRMLDCKGENPAQGAGVWALDTAASTVRLTTSQVFIDAGLDGRAVRLGAAGNNHICSQLRTQGQLQQPGGGSVALPNCVIETDTVPAIELGGTAFAVLIQTLIVQNNPPPGVYTVAAIAGGGGILTTDATFTGTGRTIDPALTQVAGYFRPARSLLDINADEIAFRGDDLVRIDTTNNPVTYTLPPMASVVSGTRTTCKHISGANLATVAAAAADNIDGAPSVALVLGTPIEFQATAAGRWEIV